MDYCIILEEKSQGKGGEGFMNSKKGFIAKIVVGAGILLAAVCCVYGLSNRPAALSRQAGAPAGGGDPPEAAGAGFPPGGPAAGGGAVPKPVVHLLGRAARDVPL